MSKKRPSMADENIIKVQEPMATRIKELAKDNHIGFHDYVNEILGEFVREHRSGKPPVLPEERYAERAGDDGWASVCL